MRIVEQPAEMRNCKTLPFVHGPPVTVELRAVQVADIIGKSMVTSVIRRPFLYRALARHLPAYANKIAHALRCFKSPVREIPMKTD